MNLERTNYASGAPKEDILGYSRVVKTGPFIEVGGTTSVQPDGSVYAEYDSYGQVKYVLEKQIKLVEDAGGKKEDIYKFKIFCTPKYDFKEGMRAVKEVFGEEKPLCTVAPIHSLVRPPQVIEIELSACIGCGSGSNWEGIYLKKECIPFKESGKEAVSAAVKVGPFIYIAGIAVEDDALLERTKENADAQDDYIYEKGMVLVEQLGGCAEDVVKIDSLATKEFRKHRGLEEETFYQKYFKPVKPLHTMLYVPGMEKENQLVQHELFAVKGCGGEEPLEEWGNIDFCRLNIASGSPLEEKSGYSRIVKTGPFVYCGGTTSVQPDGTVACEKDSLGQESYVIKKFMNLLEPLGIEPEEVTQCRAYRTPDYNKYKGDTPGYYAEILKPVRPLYTGLHIEELTRPSQLVEFEMNAVVGCGEEQRKE